MLFKKHCYNFFRDITSISGAWIYGLIGLSFLLNGNLYVFITLLIGVLIIQIIAIIIRAVYFKERPNKEDYNSFWSKIDASSFPSTHSARAVFMAAILAQYFSNIWLTVLFYTVAIAIITSRIYLKKHDIKDVLSGTLIGIITYLIIIYFQNSFVA